jgi:hypothetical protein
MVDKLMALVETLTELQVLEEQILAQAAAEAHKQIQEAETVARVL